MRMFKRGTIAAGLVAATAMAGLSGCNSGNTGTNAGSAGASTGAPSAAGSPFGSTGTSNLPRADGGASSGATTQ